MHTTTSQTSTITAPLTFDYKAELTSITTEIETKLKHQFKDHFNQIDQKFKILWSNMASSMKSKNVLMLMWWNNLATSLTKLNASSNLPHWLSQQITHCCTLEWEFIMSLQQKTLHFKCYLSKTIVYKKDPHWCSANRASYGGRRSSLCWVGEWNKVWILVVCSFACCLAAFTCWLKYLCPWTTQCSKCWSGRSSIVSSSWQ